MLDYNSSHFHFFQVCQSNINSLVKYLEGEDVILVSEFGSRFTHIMKLSIQPGVSGSQCNFDKLIDTLHKNVRKFDFFIQENTSEEREEKLQKFLKLISVKVTPDSKYCVTCIFHQIQRRPPRNFTEEKNAQILRQIASQLYYYFNSMKNIEISEMQILHVLHEGKTRYIFVAINQLDDKKIFQEIQTKWKKQNLEQLTAFRYEQSEADGNNNKRKTKKGKEKTKEGRSKRHTEKLKRRVFHNTKGNDLIEFIRKNHAKLKTIKTDRFVLPEPGIYFVEPQNVPKEEHKGHPEEQLCDLVQLFRRQRQKWNFQIYGKKRPCFSCLGRLRYERNEHKDLKFNQYPGYLWIPNLLKQNLEFQIKTVQTFILSPSYVAIDGSRAYSSQRFSDDESVTNQSDSDSETEELPEPTSTESSLRLNQFVRRLMGGKGGGG